jgi:hypothetical protein
MPRLCIAMLSIAVLAACGEHGQPLAPATAATAAPLASAQTTIKVEYVPFSRTVFVPCANGGAGENVVFEGVLHEVTRTTTTGSGNFSLTSNVNVVGVTGTGQITGDTYHLVGGSNVSVTMGPGETATVADSFNVIGPGPNNNSLSHVTYHITVGADGETTTEVGIFFVACQ